MNIFIAGGSGLIGRQLVPLLVRAGPRVTALTRSADGAARLQAMGAIAVLGDVFERAGLEAQWPGRGRRWCCTSSPRSALPTATRRRQRSACAPKARIGLADAAAATLHALQRGASGVFHIVQDAPGALHDGCRGSLFPAA
jgi:uncharacterized protein YbjT (DUF2867 family)